MSSKKMKTIDFFFKKKKTKKKPSESKDRLQMTKKTVKKKKEKKELEKKKYKKEKKRKKKKLEKTEIQSSEKSKKKKKKRKKEKKKKLKKNIINSSESEDEKNETKEDQEKKEEKREIQSMGKKNKPKNKIIASGFTEEELLDISSEEEEEDLIFEKEEESSEKKFEKKSSEMNLQDLDKFLEDATETSLEEIEKNNLTLQNEEEIILEEINEELEGKKDEDKVILVEEYEKGYLWVDKYKPNSYGDIIGNNDAINQVNNWLRSWEENFLFPKPKIGKRKKALKRSVLLSGKPGIGKSTCARIICKENGYEMIELNASDSRSKLSLKKEISHLTSNRTITQFFSKIGEEKKKKGRVCIVMDEVDGMSSGDRGGIRELIDLIKETRVPIICICNDRFSVKIKTLVNHCIDLRFRAPNEAEIYLRMSHICEKEQLKVGEHVLRSIIHSLNYDIRSILNHLQFLSKLTSSERERYINGLSENPTKDSLEASIFQVSQMLLTQKHKIGKEINSYFFDRNTIPLFIQQNYINVQPRFCRSEAELMDRIQRASCSMSQGDVTDKTILSNQSWKLEVDRAFQSTVFPTSCIKPGSIVQRRGYDYRLQFPVFLGKNSTRNKNIGNLMEIKHNSSKVTSVSNSLDVMDYAPNMKLHIVKELKEKGKEGFDEVFKFMENYGIQRDHVEEIEKFSDFSKKKSEVKDKFKDVSTTVRTQFTKFFNKKTQKITKISNRRRNRSDYSLVSESDVSDTEEFIVKKKIKIGKRKRKIDLSSSKKRKKK